MPNNNSSNNREWIKRCDKRIKLCKDLYKIVKNYENNFINNKEVKKAIKEADKKKIPISSINPKIASILKDADDIKGYLNDQIALNKSAKISGHNLLTKQNYFQKFDADIRIPVQEFLERAIVDYDSNKKFASRKELNDLQKAAGTKDAYSKDLDKIRNLRSKNNALLPPEYIPFRNKNRETKIIAEQREEIRKQVELNHKLQQGSQQARQQINNIGNNNMANNTYLPRNFNISSIQHIHQARGSSLLRTRPYNNNLQTAHPYAPSQPSKLAKEIPIQGNFQNNINGPRRLPISSSLKIQPSQQNPDQGQSSNNNNAETPYPINPDRQETITIHNNERISYATQKGILEDDKNKPILSKDEYYKINSERQKQLISYENQIEKERDQNSHVSTKDTKSFTSDTSTTEQSHTVDKETLLKAERANDKNHQALKDTRENLEYAIKKDPNMEKSITKWAQRAATNIINRQEKIRQYNIRNNIDYTMPTEANPSSPSPTQKKGKAPEKNLENGEVNHSKQNTEDVTKSPNSQRKERSSSLVILNQFLETYNNNFNTNYDKNNANNVNPPLVRAGQQSPTPSSPKISNTSSPKLK